MQFMYKKILSVYTTAFHVIVCVLLPIMMSHLSSSFHKSNIEVRSKAYGSVHVKPYLLNYNPSLRKLQLLGLENF